MRLVLVVWWFVQRMAALKRAYADIILSTAKEAAARVLVEERKADRYLQDLSAVKEDALSMLVRLKGVMDSKVLALFSFGSSFFYLNAGFGVVVFVLS